MVGSPTLTPFAFTTERSSKANARIAVNAEGWWLLGNHAQGWIENPENSPCVLVAVYGTNLRHRFVLGSFEIDKGGWRGVAPETGSLWPVPLKDRTEPDALGLRGRRIDVKFGRARWEHYRWVGDDGTVRPHGGP